MEDRISLNVTCNQGSSLCCPVSLQNYKDIFSLDSFFFLNDALLYGVGRVRNLDFDKDIGIHVTFIS